MRTNPGFNDRPGTGVRPVLLLVFLLILYVSELQLSTVGKAYAQEVVLFGESFDNANWASRGWYDNPDMIVDLTNRIGVTGGSAVFAWTKEGNTTAESRGGRVLFDPVEGLTLSFYIKFSDNWEWTGLGWHPHLFMFMTNENGEYDGPAYSHLTLYAEAVDGKPRLAIQDGQNIDLSRIGQNLVGVTENRAVAGGNGDSDGYGEDYYKSGDVYWNGKDWDADSVYFSDEQGLRYKGEWHYIKAHFQLNSIVDGKGIANGILQLWYDDKPVIDCHDVLFRTGRHPDMKINQFLLLPYYGPGVPHEQSIWIDELKIIKEEEELPLVDPPVQTPLLFEEDFEDSGWSARGWYDDPDMITDPANHIENSGSSAVFNWTEAGNTTAESRGGRKLIEPVEGLTLSYNIKFSDNWEWAGTASHPLALFWFVTNLDDQWTNPVSTHLTVMLAPSDGRLELGMRDVNNIDLEHLGENLVGITENRAVAGGNGNSDSYGGSIDTSGSSVLNVKRITSDSLYFNDEAGSRYKGDWHYIKAHFQLNSIVEGRGIANGVVQYWYDNKPVMDCNDVLFRTGQHPEMKINQLLMLPYFMDGVPHQQTLWIDDLKIVREERELPLTPQKSCDFNNDGNINISDVIALLLLGRSNRDDPSLDWNGDNTCTIIDAITLLLDIINENCN